MRWMAQGRHCTGVALHRGGTAGGVPVGILPDLCVSVFLVDVDVADLLTSLLRAHRRCGTFMVHLWLPSQSSPSQPSAHHHHYHYHQHYHLPPPLSHPIIRPLTSGSTLYSPNIFFEPCGAHTRQYLDVQYLDVQYLDVAHTRQYLDVAHTRQWPHYAPS